MSKEMLYTLHCADDQVVIVQDKDLEFIARKLMNKDKRWGLLVNIVNTKYLYIGGQSGDLTLNDGEEIKTCKEYVHLGTKTERNGRTEKEVEERTGKGKNITEMKWELYKSVTLYGCET